MFFQTIVFFILCRQILVKKIFDARCPEVDIVTFMGILINFYFIIFVGKCSGLISFAARCDCQECDHNVK